MIILKLIKSILLAQLILFSSSAVAGHISITECRAAKLQGVKYAYLSWSSGGEPVRIYDGGVFSIGSFPADSGTVINLGKGGAGGQASKNVFFNVCDPADRTHCAQCYLYIGGKLPKP